MFALQVFCCVGDNVDEVYSKVANVTNRFIIPTADDEILESVEIIKKFTGVFHHLRKVEPFSKQMQTEMKKKRIN